MANVYISLCVQVQGHVDDAVAKGATVTVGGSKPDLPEPYNKVPFLCNHMVCWASYAR